VLAGGRCGGAKKKKISPASEACFLIVRLVGGWGPLRHAYAQVGVLQCVAVCCSVLQRVAVWSILRHGSTQVWWFGVM